MPKSNNANNSCLVCSGASNGVCHFGVQCCRACASFFHRTMKEKRKYNCRWEQNCQISNTDGLRNSCRACRLKKCFQVGMAEEKKRDGKSCGRESSSSPSPAVDEPTSSIQMTTSFVETLRQYNNAFRALSVVEGISTDLVGSDLGLQKARVINYQEYMRMLKGSVLLTYSMLCQQLPEIRDFNSENKAKLLKTFHNQFYLIREAQMTVQACIDPNSPFALVVPGGLINADHLEDNFFMDFPDSEQKQKFAQFVHWHFDFCRERFYPVRPNQLEFAAITGILFWNSLERAVPDALSGEQIMHRKETLFAELFTIIMRDQQQQGDTVQAAVRFGRLIDLVHQLTVHTWEMDELFAMAKIFNDLPDIWDQVVL